MSNRVFNEKQIEFIKENYMEMTYSNMSRIELFTGLSEKQIRNKARNIGLSKTRKFNDRYFKVIDNHEKSYWLGFIYADGNVYINRDRGNAEMRIEIHQKDEYILYHLKKSLGDVHDISRRERDISFNGYEYTTKTSSLRIYSKNIAYDLVENGVVPNKTESSVFPKVKDEELFFSFMRGFFDGDGCLYWNNKGLSLHFTNSSSDVFEYMQQTLKTYNIQTNIYKEKEKKYKMFVSVRDIPVFLEKIYKNSNNLKLKRKYDIYAKWLSSQEIEG